MRELNDQELLSHYLRVIKPKFFNKHPTAQEPTCIFLGGQPGAGKSYLADTCIKTLANQSAVTINTDALREHHPRLALISEKEVYSLDKDCYQWGEMLIRDCLTEKKNVVFDGTFGGSVNHSHDLMKRFKADGYKVELSLLAVNDVVSRIGCEYRYQLGVKNIGSSRPVDQAYHDEIYSRIPFNLLNTIEQNLIDKFIIFERNHQNKTLLPKKIYNSEELQKRTVDPVQAYVNARVQHFAEIDVKTLNAWKEATERLIKENGRDVTEFRTGLKTKDVTADRALKNQICEISGLTRNQIRVLNTFQDSIEAITTKIFQLDKLPNTAKLIHRHTKHIESLRNNIKLIEAGKFDFAALRKYQCEKVLRSNSLK
jgi:predicted ABC-type ATPase